jgi:hypothetical protein
MQPTSAGWKDPKAVEAHYQKLCETLHITTKVFRVCFYIENGPQDVLSA